MRSQRDTVSEFMSETLTRLSHLEQKNDLLEYSAQATDASMRVLSTQVDAVTKMLLQRIPETSVDPDSVFLQFMQVCDRHLFEKDEDQIPAGLRQEFSMSDSSLYDPVTGGSWPMSWRETTRAHFFDQLLTFNNNAELAYRVKCWEASTKVLHIPMCRNHSKKYPFGGLGSAPGTYNIWRDIGQYRGLSPFFPRFTETPWTRSFRDKTELFAEDPSAHCACKVILPGCLTSLTRRESTDETITRMNYFYPGTDLSVLDYEQRPDVLLENTRPLDEYESLHNSETSGEFEAFTAPSAWGHVIIVPTAKEIYNAVTLKVSDVELLQKMKTLGTNWVNHLLTLDHPTFNQVTRLKEADYKRNHPQNQASLIAALIDGRFATGECFVDGTVFQKLRQLHTDMYEGYIGPGAPTTWQEQFDLIKDSIVCTLNVGVAPIGAATSAGLYMHCYPSCMKFKPNFQLYRGLAKSEAYHDVGYHGLPHYDFQSYPNETPVEQVIACVLSIDTERIRTQAPTYTPTEAAKREMDDRQDKYFWLSSTGGKMQSKYFGTENRVSSDSITTGDTTRHTPASKSPFSTRHTPASKSPFFKPDGSDGGSSPDSAASGLRARQSDAPETEKPESKPQPEPEPELSSGRPKDGAGPAVLGTKDSTVRNDENGGKMRTSGNTNEKNTPRASAGPPKPDSNGSGSDSDSDLKGSDLKGSDFALTFSNLFSTLPLGSDSDSDSEESGSSDSDSDSEEEYDAAYKRVIELSRMEALAKEAEERQAENRAEDEARKKKLQAQSPRFHPHELEPEPEVNLEEVQRENKKIDYLKMIYPSLNDVSARDFLEASRWDMDTAFAAVRDAVRLPSRY